MATGIQVALQTKIYTLLSADATLVTTYGCDVFDHTPDNEPYPFITIGEDTLDEFGAHDFDGFSATLEIHTWTQAEGKKACKQIQDRIYALLHETDLALSGQKTLSLRGGLQTTILDPDGRTYHGVNRFNLLLGG